MAQANVKLTVDATGATKALNSVQSSTNRLQKSFGGLQTAIAGIGVGLLARNTITAATSFEKLNQRLKILTQENGSYSQSLKLANEAQAKFGLSSIDALEGVTNLQARLGPLGSSMEEITAIFNGFNTAAILSGASAQEQAGAMRQLTQALGSGVLRGDEFNSISEQMSAVLKPIADQLGVNVGALREMAANGKITKDVVVAAFKEIEKQGGKALKELIKNDPTMVFKILNNEVEKLSIELGSVFAPAVLDATNALTNLISGINSFLNTSEGQTALVITGIAFAVKGLTAASGLLSAALTVLIAKFKLTSAGAIAMAKAQATASVSTKALAIASGGLSIALNALPLVAIAGGFVFLTNAIIKAINKQKEFNKLLEEGSSADIQSKIEETTKLIGDLEAKIAKITEGQKGFQLISGAEALEADLKKANDELKKLEERLVITQGIELFKDFEKAKDALKAKNKQLKETEERLKIGTEEGRKQFDIDLKRKELTEKFGEDLANELIELEKKNNLLEEGVKKIKKQEEAAKELKAKFMEIGQGIEQGIVSNLTDAVMGTKTLAQAAVSVLNDLKRKLVEVAIQKAVSGIGNSLGGFLGGIFGGRGGGGSGVKFGSVNLGIGQRFADGGRPPVGRASLVGEKGPELFVPSRSGTIIPNNQIGGGTTNIVNVSVDASGSSVSGNDQDAQALGNVIAVAIRSELIKEKRAGGLLSR